MTHWEYERGKKETLEWVKEQIEKETRIWQIGQETENNEMEYVDFLNSVIYQDVIKKILEDKG